MTNTTLLAAANPALGLDSWAGQLISLGGWGLLIVLLVTRMLVTRAELDRAVEREQQRTQDMAADRDEWKAVAQIEREARQAAEGRAEGQEEDRRLTLEILQALKLRADREDWLDAHQPARGELTP